jgi:hypothetical protein
MKTLATTGPVPIVLRNGQDEDIARGVRDETLPDPGP